MAADVTDRKTALQRASRTIGLTTLLLMTCFLMPVRPTPPAPAEQAAAETSAPDARPSNLSSRPEGGAAARSGGTSPFPLPLPNLSRPSPPGAPAEGPPALDLTDPLLTQPSSPDTSPIEPISVAKLAPVIPARLPEPKPAAKPKHHPRHIVKVWLTQHRGRTFRVIQLPRCEHMEAVIAYNRRGETKEQAKDRLGGVAVCSGAFHNSRSMALADFYQIDGCIVSSARTGRWFLALMDDGTMDLSGDYNLLKGTPGVTALALGQRLAPQLYKDGFTTQFMNRVTDRMALGMSHDYIFIIQGKSDIWRLADFIQKKLPCDIAINSDGGHVVRGRAPVHIVFRWRDTQPTDTPTPASNNPDDASDSDDQLTTAQSPLPVHAEG